MTTPSPPSRLFPVVVGLIAHVGAAAADTADAARPADGQFTLAAIVDGSAALSAAVAGGTAHQPAIAVTPCGDAADCAEVTAPDCALRYEPPATAGQPPRVAGLACLRGLPLAALPRITIDLAYQKPGEEQPVHERLAFRPVARASGEAKWSLRAEKNKYFPQKPGLAIIYYHTEAGGWTRADARDGLGADAIAATAWVREIDKPDGARAYYQISLVSAAAEPDAGDAPAPAAEPAKCPRSEYDNEYHIIICVDLTGDSPRLVGQRFKRGLVILPNRSILVQARHHKGSVLAFDLDGDRGLAEPRVRGGAKDDGAAHGGAPDEAVAETRWSEARFAPRKPGKADLTITRSGGDKFELELEVEPTYAGALRLGFGLIGGGAINADYAARVVPPSGQAEIVAVEANQFDLEVVVGFAPFLEYFEGGRGYFTGHNWRLAPYVGLGVLDQEQGSLRTLTSLHLGAELEITPQFSIAVTAVGRRVVRLADGLHVGDPAPEGAGVTQRGLHMGFAIVFNLSPGFAKLLVKGGSSFSP